MADVKDLNKQLVTVEASDPIVLFRPVGPVKRAVQTASVFLFCEIVKRPRPEDSSQRSLLAVSTGYQQYAPWSNLMAP